MAPYAPWCFATLVLPNTSTDMDTGKELTFIIIVIIIIIQTV